MLHADISSEAEEMLKKLKKIAVKFCLSVYKTYKQVVDAARRGWGRSTQPC